MIIVASLATRTRENIRSSLRHDTAIGAGTLVVALSVAGWLAALRRHVHSGLAAFRIEGHRPLSRRPVPRWGCHWASRSFRSAKSRQAARGRCRIVIAAAFRRLLTDDQLEVDRPLGQA